MKEENTNNFYIRSFVVILLSTIIALLGLHSVEFLLLIFPVVFIANIVEDGIGEGIMNMIVTILIVTMVESLKIGLFFALGFIPFTVTISLMIKSRRGNLKIIGYSALAFFISILGIMTLTRLMGIDVVKYIENLFRGPVDMQLEALENMGLSNYELFRSTEALESRYKYILLIIPASILIISALISYINYLLSGIILERLGIKIVNMPKLYKFSLPNNIILGTILMVGLTFISGQLGFTYYSTVLVNIMVIIMLGFFAQGLAVVDFVLNKLKFNPFFKILLYISFIFTQAFTTLLAVLGFVDLIFDLRKIRRRKIL